LSIKVAHSPS